MNVVPTGTAGKPDARPTPPPSRMKLTALVSGRLKKPKKVIAYGPEGIGKTTFGANAPSPIFLCAEQGTEQLDVIRFPTPNTWSEVLEAIRELTTAEHSFRTLVIDTLDWLEPLLFAHVCELAKVKTIEDVGGGYGKGYTAAVDHWRTFLRALETLRDSKNMHVVMLAHSKVKTFNNPEGENFDRYEMAINEKAAGLIRQWADDVLFANYETFVAKGKGFAKNKGVDTGARLLFTTRRAAFDAKNRDGLPDTLPLSWSEFFEASERHVPAGNLDDLRSEIERKAKEVGGDIEKAALESLTKFTNDGQKLAVLNNRLNAKLAEKSAEEEKKDA